MKTAFSTPHCSSPDIERSTLSPSHLRKRRRSQARRGLAAAAPRLTAALPHLLLAAPQLASARPTAVEVRCLDAVTLHDPDGNFRRDKVPQVLHIDADIKSATVLAALLMPEARVTHAASLAQARALLATHIYSLVVLDPQLPDGDADALMPLLAATPLLVYASRHPEWRVTAGRFLPKPWTTPRQLWSTVSGMLGIAGGVAAGD